MGTLEKQCVSKVHEKQKSSERVDIRENLSSNFTSLFLGNATGGSRATKRKRIIESESDSSSELDADPDNEEELEDSTNSTPSYCIPKKGRRIWDSKQMENLKTWMTVCWPSCLSATSRQGKARRTNRIAC